MQNIFMKRGFTLVELSIVLVIIGLLIGGILAAQSMISTAKLQSVIREMQQYDVAVSNFQTKYNSIPGDTTSFSPPGNGDGSLFTQEPTHTYNNCDGNWSQLHEVREFWIHLQQGGFNPRNYNFIDTVSGTGLSSDPSAANVPVLSFSRIAQVIAVSGHCPNYTEPDIYNYANGLASSIYKNHFVILNLTQSQYVGNVQDPVFTPAEAAAIDLKMDDGKPYFGNVTATRDSGVFMGAKCMKNAFDYNTDYDFTQKTPQCELSITMLSQTGQNP